MTDVEITFDVPVPMRDGAVLRADVYRPTGTGPWPVLVQRIPYDKRAPAGGRDERWRSCRVPALAR